MSKIFVAGLINIETTLKIESFPIPYYPVRFPFWGINSSVSGVGFNISKALTNLGDEVQFASIIGQDAGGELAYSALGKVKINTQGIIQIMSNTAQSIVIYDESGKRQIHTDLKNIQEVHYPQELMSPLISGCDLAVICDINFARPALKIASNFNIPIATDAHTLSDFRDTYHADFLKNAQIVFLSDEKLPCPPKDFARSLIGEYGIQIVVIGMGAEGAYIATQVGYNDYFPAISSRPIVNTIGAGDALFSCFLHEYLKGNSLENALRRAMLFASYKIGSVGAADGFLDAKGLDELSEKLSRIDY